MIQTQILGNNALVYLPNVEGNYGVSIMFQGMGEAGNAAIDKADDYGFANFIQQGKFSPSYAVVAIQQKNTWITPAQIDGVITEILKEYPRIDPKKINLTGLSAGAKVVFAYVLDQDPYRKRINNIVVFSMPIVDKKWLDRYETTRDFPQWHLIGNLDTHTAGDFYHPELGRAQVAKQEGWLNFRYTEWTGGHSGWNTFYNPQWKDTDGVSLDAFIRAYFSLSDLGVHPNQGEVAPVAATTTVTQVAAATKPVATTTTKAPVSSTTTADPGFALEIQADSVTSLHAAFLEDSADTVEPGTQDIGGINQNSYAEFLVPVPVAATYKLGIRTASPTSTKGNASVQVTVNGQNFVAQVPFTKGWQDYQTWDAGQVTLPQGEVTIRFTSLRGGFNIHSFILVP
jgi:hypothetical protein